MTKYQKRIALKLIKDTKRLTVDEMSARIAVELAILVLKIEGRL